MCWVWQWNQTKVRSCTLKPHHKHMVCTRGISATCVYRRFNVISRVINWFSSKNQDQNWSFFNSIGSREVTLLVHLAGPWACNLNVLSLTEEKTVLAQSCWKKYLHCHLWACGWGLLSSTHAQHLSKADSFNVTRVYRSWPIELYK